MSLLDDEREGRAFRERWMLAPDVTYLNHGSFGPPPREVFQAHEEWSARLAANPMDFLVRQLGGHLQAARTALAELVGCADDSLAFVDNATTGMNIVAASTPLAAGDEILTTDHDYGAVIRLWRQHCDDAGARLIVQPVPLPLDDPQKVVAAIAAGITPRTRLIVVSHITSATAIVFPVEQICRLGRERGIAVCIDGPHAIAALPLRLDALDCDYYTASCHKWLCAPFGSGFLYVHPRRQRAIRPAVVSWGRCLPADCESWRDEFNWVGTRNPAPWLSIPAAINFLQASGVERFRERSLRLVRYAGEKIGALTGLSPLTPERTGDHAWIGTMAAFPLPPGPSEPLQAALWDRHRIEIPIVSWNDRRLVRVSCHLYTTPSEIDRLVTALQPELARQFAAS